MLPAAARAKVDQAHSLMQRAGATATPSQGENDVEVLRKKLADAEEAARKATERANASDGIARKNGAELRAVQQGKVEADAKVKQLEGELTKKLENHSVTSLTDEERRLAGDDMVTMAAKVAREVTDNVLAQIMPGVNDRVAKIERVGEEAFFAVLESEVPTWAAVNDDPQFVAWLNLNDPATNLPRMNRLKRAEALRQGYLVAEVFKAFLGGREIGALSTGARPTPQVDPGSGGGNAPLLEGQDGKRAWTRADISAHYRQKQQGVWNGRMKEWRDLELDLIAAQGEGRIRG